ncbi:MAG: 16S rRNA (guanine(527)-N(7))-methyltransferase RsmG [Clostridia bacterium]|nr:16S rRNA (guanine(527)-N(7))-methyltransferase RsmG [Clostridia bacterium]MDE7328595.1 16S rRNA (guanine(527)-N(7))-methyltransferase RsmG [Clostridia bacterium]
MQNLTILENYLKEKNLYSEEILRKFGDYFLLLEDWNKKINLTAITSLEDVQIKHFIDSLLGNDLIQGSLSVCDIGCGAGFPSIPLAILNPNIEFTLVDSVNKKIEFIKEVKKELSLDNITTLHSRVEDFAKENFQKFDICVARAVAALPTLAEYTLPLVKVGGKLIAYKGINYKEELENSNKILCILNSKVQEIREYSLVGGDKRFIIIVEKDGDCPKKYPRGGNKPRISPILG